MNKSIKWFVVIGVLLVSLGCSLFVPSTPPPPSEVGTELTEAPVETKAPVETESPVETEAPVNSSSGGLGITVENKSPYDICYVLISVSGAEDWGEDWLGDDEYIYAGESWSMDLPAGEYDVLVADCEQTVLDTAWEIGSDTVLTVGSEDEVAVRVINDSPDEICYLYISPTQAGEWGEDQLGLYESLYADAQRIFFVAPGVYDLRAVDCNDVDVLVESEVSIDIDFVWSIQQQEVSGDPFVLSIENNTAEDICYVYISPANSESWGSDWLGDDNIAPGDSRDFDIPGGAQDVTIKNCDNVTLDTAWDISAATTLRLGGEGEVPVTVVNNGTVDICYLYISESSLEEWGPDSLGDNEYLVPDSARRFYIAPGVYDLQALDCEGLELALEYEVSIDKSFTWEVE